MNSITKAKALTYLGAIPFFIALAIACYGYFNMHEVFGSEIRFTRFKSYMIAHTYGAVIVAFLGGIQWGISLHQPADKQYFIIGIVLALLAWSSLFSFASFIGLVMILTAFILAFWVDRHAYHSGLIPQWFWHLRTNISGIVIISLLGLILINQ